MYVISKVDTKITMKEVQDYENNKVGKSIQFLHEPINLAYEYSSWRTIAIELSDNDYELLSKPEIWPSDTTLRDFTGQRWWRNKASNLTPIERKSSVRQQWTSA